VVLGLSSSGVHSNGYSLVRKVVKEAGLDLARVYEELRGTSGKGAKGQRGKVKRKRAARDETTPPTLGQVLLTPTRIYARSITRLLAEYRVKKVISGMAHITGSGMAGNLERALNKKVDAVVDYRSWPRPQVFPFLQAHGNIDEAEMRRVFNLGIGYTLVVRPDFVEGVREKLKRAGESVHEIGKIVKGTGKVRGVDE
jgi:phosphoribosylformylglycinamidine cyclo-ligase